MKLRLNANAIVQNKEGKVLMIRLKKGPYAGRFCIPGGGIEPGELSEETIRREILEETGIELKSEVMHFGFCELMRKTSDDQRIVLLLHTVAEGTPRESEEGVSQWMEVEEAKEKGIPFTKEAIRIWELKQNHFTLIE